MRVVFSTIIGSARDHVLVLVDKYSDPRVFERALSLAWTQARVQLHHLGIETDEAQKAVLGKTFLEALRAAGGGSIVNVSSIDGLEGMSYVSAYAATKWGLRGLAKCAALELGRDGIRVNTVCPAGGSDEMAAPWRRPGAKDDTGYMDKRPIPRRGTVDEIAAMILFLASDEASFCTGGDFPVDGGHSAGTRLPTRVG